MRLDTTSVSVYADRDQVAVLFQHGHSKDHRPDLRQFKVMLAALDPLGVVVAADVVAGHRADDGLYLPTLLRLQTTLGESGMLYIGDAKMGALATGLPASQRQPLSGAAGPQVGQRSAQAPRRHAVISEIRRAAKHCASHRAPSPRSMG